MIIDGSNLLYRVHAICGSWQKPQFPTVFCFLQSVFKYRKHLEKQEVDYTIALVFDGPRCKLRRAKVIPEYKNHRMPKPEVLNELGIIHEALEKLGIPHMQAEDGYEADDVIASMSKQAVESDMEVLIVSNDKDMTQLVRDGVRLWKPPKDFEVDTDFVEERFGVKPHQVVDLLALAGDDADNVKGVPGIGFKRAAHLLKEFGSLDNISEASRERLVQVPGIGPVRTQALLDRMEQILVNREKIFRLKEDIPGIELIASPTDEWNCEELLQWAADKGVELPRNVPGVREK